MNRQQIIRMTLASLGLLLVMATPTFAQQNALDGYNAAIERWFVGYLTATAEMTVQIGDNDPATYTLKMWLKGNDKAVSVVTAADVDFLLGLALLEEGKQVTAWWPTLGTSKTFAASQTGEEVGLSSGWLEQVGQHPEDYTATPVDEDATEWRLEIRPTEEDGLFDHATVHVTKSNQTISVAEFYDSSDRLVETDNVNQYTQEQREDGHTILFPLQTVVIDPIADKTTTIDYTDLSFPEHIDEALFTLDSLKQMAEQALNGKL
jgi:outer membrane lipoprotein-sorting protein